MSHKLLEEWRLFTKDQSSIPPESLIIDFCDQRELVLSYNDKDCSRDVKPSSHKPFSRQTNGSSTTKSNKSQFSLHAKELVHCKLCPSEKHPLYLCPEFKSRDVSSHHQTIQSLQACFNCLGTNHSSRQCTSKSRYVLENITLSFTCRLVNSFNLHTKNVYVCHTLPFTNVIHDPPTLYIT